MRNDSEYFPRERLELEGIQIVDKIAMDILPTLIAKNYSPKDAARTAYDYADALIQESKTYT